MCRNTKDDPDALGRSDRCAYAAPMAAAPRPSPVAPGVSRTDGVQSAVRRENALLRELVAVYSHLSGLASQDADVDAVVRLVARRTGATVLVLGPGQDLLAAVPADAGDRLAAATGSAPLGPVLAAAAQNRRPVTLPGLGDGSGDTGGGPVVVAPILVGDEVAAHLVTVPATDGSRGEDLDDDLALLLTEHAATICGFVLGRERVVAAAAGRARTDLLEGLLLARDRDDGEAERWAGHLGFVPGTPHHVLALALVESPSAPRTGPDRARLLGITERALARRLQPAIVAVRDTEVVAVVPAGERTRGLEGVRALAGECRAAVLERHPEVRLVAGVGGCCATAAEISRSYTQARGAIEAARRMGGPRRPAPGVLAFDDLGVHRLLLQVPDLAELRAFVADVLGELVREDQRGELRADLVGTLTEWFRSGGSPQRTARELHVHPNTVTYRIRRVEEITGLRLDHYRDRLMAQVACEIVQVLGEGT
jgi:sugar diacid utilization regulator